MANADASLTSPSSRTQLYARTFCVITNNALDRLPTVSASQALQSFHARGARSVSTGLSQLDQLLTPPSLPGHDASGGYMRGKVTEIFGPSGVGKTAFG
jgi:hypothetical protein